MKTSTVLTTALNIFTLFVGITIGLLIRPYFSAAVQAQQPAPETKLEEIQPGITVGSAGIGILLSNQVEADRLVVNGIDIVKLNEGILNYLATRPTAERADLQKIIDSSKPAIFYRMKQPTPAKPEPQKSGTPEKKEPSK